MDLLGNSKNNETPVFRAHVERTLREHSEEIKEAQSKAISSFSSDFWRDIRISNTDKSLIHQHKAVHRFGDMKVRFSGEDGTVRKKKKSLEIHNRILMEHYNGILNDLTYGLRLSIEKNFKDNFDNKII